MLHLIPAPLHRLLYRAAYQARRIWWQIRRPRHGSVLVVGFDESARVLLVRHSYGPRVWTLPGGGLANGEEPIAAARREIGEELGCDLADLQLVETAEERTAGSFEARSLIVARLVGEPVPDMREIVAVAFADPERLPDACGTRARQSVAQAMAFKATVSQKR